MSDSELDSLARECAELSQARSRQHRAVELEALMVNGQLRWTAMAPARPARFRDRWVTGHGDSAATALRQLAGALRRMPTAVEPNRSTP